MFPFHWSENEIKIGLPKGLIMQILFFPGRWMTEGQLNTLRQKISEFSIKRLGALPEYGIYLASREAWQNRIITVVYEKKSGLIKGVTAMFYQPLQIDNRIESIIHLGLVILERHYSIKYLLFVIYYLPLFFFSSLRGFNPCWITSVSMEPAIIGLVSDCFNDTFPHYYKKTRLSKLKAKIANNFFTHYGNEFGVGPNAVLNLNTFVIEGSCRGPSEALRVDFSRSARYVIPLCNEFCKNTLNYERGDELLQIGKISIASVFCSPASFWKSLQQHKKQ